MRTFDSSITTALANRKGIRQEDLVWVKAKDSGGSPVEYAVWTGVDTQAINVVSGETGLVVSRNYVGTGRLLSISPIIQSSDLTIKQITVSLNNLDPTVFSFLRGYNLRKASIEIHRVIRNLDTTQFINNAQPRFVGWVNEVPEEIPEIGGSAAVRLICVSNTALLTNKNFERKSDTTQRLRSDDRFRRYGSLAAISSIFWGEERSTT